MVSPIADLPVVSDGEPDDPVWYPLRHALGIDTFGANVFVARHADQVLVEDHEERETGQQELYLLLDGSAVFLLDGEEARLERGDALAVTGPGVRRGARALIAQTMLLVVGAAEADSSRRGTRRISWTFRGRTERQSGSSGMEKPGSRPSRTARVIEALP